MSTTHRYIANPSEPLQVMAWFRALDAEITEVPTSYGYALYFRGLGPLSHLPDGNIDAEASPVVTVIAPQVRRGVIWTVGEVQFRSTPLQKRFPPLHSVNRSLSKWLASFDCVYSNKRNENPYSYYLEGSSRNYDSPIYAFPSGLAALKKEQYFVAHLDNDSRLETICRSLRLRGVNCALA